MECVKRLNFFPVQGGISPYHSPRTIIEKRPLDYQVHCKFAFGALVQANQDLEQTNTNESRTIDGLYLGPIDNLQGGHKILDIHTHRVVTRRKVIPIPVTKLVIQHIEDWAKRDKVKSLKFKNRIGVIYDADWIAGVDYAEDINQPDTDNLEIEEEEDGRLGEFHKSVGPGPTQLIAQT